MRKVLIADDGKINREILKKILCKDYDIIEAENGEDAVRMMHRYYKMLSAIVLDLMMPVMDGYEVLRRIRDNPVLAQIPIIVITSNYDEESRVRALALGANDFVTKPYNTEIIRHCLRNNIKLRETASIVNAMQHDKLTGIYGREAFFEKAEAVIKGNLPETYVMACFDIDNFKLVNDQYGAIEGDRILKHIGSAIKKAFNDVHGICGRISGDNFAGIFPNTPEAEERITFARNDYFLPNDTHFKMSFSVGRYVISDLSLSASAMYDRAYIAKQSIKGLYSTHLAYFDDSMLRTLINEQNITSDMGEALSKRQFEVWLQPQINYATGSLIGAEALARWRHPERGLISPTTFIPVFEQNGFIYELDKYVWEKTCALLRKWLDEGKDPLPVSVNISRYDIFRADFIEVLNGLVDLYDIPTSLLRLEITESSFVKSPEQIIEVINKLVECGYMIEIDDFGSGYSSLNTLKDVPSDILKLDMRFLENDGASQRGGNILESVVRMARWLGMSVIAEGVEKKEQADFLKSIGCNYIQGYLYAKPMPPEEYESFMKSRQQEKTDSAFFAVEHFNNNSFYDPMSLDTLIFNSYVGGACIFEFISGKIEPLRSNDKFALMLSNDTMSVEDVLKLDWKQTLDEESYKRLSTAICCSAADGNEITDEYVFRSLPDCPRDTYMRLNLRVIAAAGNRYLVYATGENITAQHEAEKRAYDKQLELLDNLPCGAALYEYDGGALTLVHLNKRYKELVNRYEDGGAPIRALDTVHPDDTACVLEKIKAAVENGNDAEGDIRLLHGKNEYRSFHAVGKIVPSKDGKYTIYATYTPI